MFEIGGPICGVVPVYSEKSVKNSYCNCTYTGSPPCRVYNKQNNLFYRHLCLGYTTFKLGSILALKVALDWVENGLFFVYFL